MWKSFENSLRILCEALLQRSMSCKYFMTTVGLHLFSDWGADDPPPPLPHTKLSQLPTPQILYRTSYVLIYLSLYFSLIHILFSFNLYVTLLFALRLYIAIYSHFFFNIRNPPSPLFILQGIGCAPWRHQLRLRWPESVLLRSQTKYYLNVLPHYRSCYSHLL